MIKTVKLYYKRKFLNKISYHAGAFILAKIEREIWSRPDRKTKKKNTEITHNIALDVADCSRIISLDLDLCTIRGAKNSIRKLDILIETMQGFREVFNKEMKFMKNNKKR